MENKTEKLIRLWYATLLLAFLGVFGAGNANAVIPFNHQNTDIREMVQLVSKATGRNFIIDPAVRGTITFVSGSGLNENELYEAFLSILQVHGFEAIEVGNVTKIVPLNKGRSQVAPIINAPGTTGQQQPRIEADKTVTQVFTLQYIPVNTAIQTLQPLAGQGETRIQFNQASNAVIVTGRKQNVDRLADVISNIDKPNNQGFELVALRHSVANQLANTLRGLMASGRTADGGAIPQQIYISVDQRTNSILVAGDKADRERMRQVISKLDIPRTQPPATQVVKVRYADANQLLQTLRQLQIAPATEGGAAVRQVRMAVDRNTNSIILSGESEDREPILAAIKRLDVPPSQPPDTQVVKLQHADAAKLLQTLKQLQIAPQEGQSVKQARMAIDESTNSIIIAGDRQDRMPILAAIKRLDVPRTKPLETQVIPIRYAVASQVIQTLKQLQVAPTDGNNAQQVRLAADERTNSVLISGKHTDRLPIIAAIRKLDIPRAQSGGTRVVRLRYAQASDIVSVLKETAQSIERQTAGTTAGGANGANNAAAVNTSQVSIQADKPSNSVIITAPQHMQVNLQRVISQLDQRRAQVMVEAIIAEVSTDFSNKLGIGVASEGRFNNTPGVAISSNFGGGLSTALGLASSTLTSIPGGLLLGLGAELGSSRFGLVLEALQGDGATNILSTPTLVTLDNEEASIVVGQNVPFITGSTTTDGVSNPFQTIQRQDVGLTLKVTPQINRDKTITMKIEQEVSSLASSSAASDVITNKRSINTNVMVEDGQILVLGGLIQDDFRDSESKVPVLSDLPIIGGIFRENTTTKAKQNLMAFIHPVILPDRLAADAYTRSKYHTLQQQQQRSQVLQRGSSTGVAAVFPNIECVQGECARGRNGSADNLHFVQQQQQHRYQQHQHQAANRQVAAQAGRVVRQPAVAVSTVDNLHFSPYMARPNYSVSQEMFLPNHQQGPQPIRGQVFYR